MFTLNILLIGKMIKKCFVITEFGEPFEWTQKYIDNATKLAKDGWYWMIFTPNQYKSTKNVAVISMDAAQFGDLVEKKLGVKPQMFITPKGVPSVHITDFYVFTGLIFADYLKDMDYWGITNLDIVYGNLSNFIPDEEISKYQIWTDDVGPGGGIVNGIFSLWKNTPQVNNLCYKIENWRAKIGQNPCPSCVGTGDSHTLFGTDEIEMVPIVQNEPNLYGDGDFCGHPKHYPLHSYDRLEQHRPEPKLELKEDGSLWEKFNDTVTGYVAAKEIAYFHFSYTKKWPMN